MAFCRAVFLLALSVSLQSVLGNTVPVFLWGDLATTSIKSNPLSKISPEEFDDILREELKKDQFTVIFTEETLSVEDFSLKNSDGETSFPYLHSNIRDAVYLPAVDNAMTALNNIADPEKSDQVKLTENGLSAQIERDGGNFLFITLKDAKEGESRFELLRRHNDFMEDMFAKLQARYGKVVAVYTARNPSWTIPELHSRSKRQAVADNNGSYALDDLLLYVQTLELIDGTQRTVLSELTSSDVKKNETSNELDVTLEFGDRKVTLFFNNAIGYWYFTKVEVSADNTVEALYPSIDVYSIDGFSYRCSQAVNFTSVNATKDMALTFNNLKIQAFSGNASDFSESLNCVGFFSVPIWAGLFVVLILLSITFYGIMMMMDIRTMDRFDDPKGKTITINAGE